MNAAIDRTTFRKMAEGMLKENHPMSDLLLAYADAWDAEVDQLLDAVLEAERAEDR